MKITRYSVVDEFDLDHSITEEVDSLKRHINNINNLYSKKDAKVIKKAMIETILENL